MQDFQIASADAPAGLQSKQLSYCHDVVFQHALGNASAHNSYAEHGASERHLHSYPGLALLRQGRYSSLFFSAEPARTPESNLPVSFRFTESGVAPPGMMFETYPCNKPDTKVCPQVASSNGIFLDGTPTETGSYTFVITAIDTVGRRVSRQFTIVVNSSDQSAR
jgi:hypothetical protein